jgi:hypothetical protein
MALAPPEGAPVVCRHATSLAHLSQKPMLANKAIDAALKRIQGWDNTIYICRRANAGFQSACL